MKHRDSRQSLRSPSVGVVVAVGTAAVLLPLVAMVAIAQPLFATAVVAGLLVVSGAGGLRRWAGRVEHEGETGRVSCLEQTLLTLSRGSDTDQ